MTAHRREHRGDIVRNAEACSKNVNEILMDAITTERRPQHRTNNQVLRSAALVSTSERRFDSESEIL